MATDGKRSTALAMAAGVTNRLFDVSDLVAVLTESGPD